MILHVNKNERATFWNPHCQGCCEDVHCSNEIQPLHFCFILGIGGPLNIHTCFRLWPVCLSSKQRRCLATKSVWRRNLQLILSSACWWRSNVLPSSTTSSVFVFFDLWGLLGCGGLGPKICNIPFLNQNLLNH